MYNKIYRGEFYYIQPAVTTGSEQWQGRPGVIVSDDEDNERSQTVIVALMTTKPKEALKTHVETNSCARPSTILCESIRQVSKQLLGDYMGKLEPEKMPELDRALLAATGIKSAAPAAQDADRYTFCINGAEVRITGRDININVKPTGR